MDLSGLSGEQVEAPELATVRFEMFRWRFGKLVDHNGSFQGVTLEIYHSALPWLKFRFPFLRLDIRRFHTELGGLLDDEQWPEETSPETGT